MSDGQNDVAAQPLVIVRRRRGGEETHHGGVWKIAYADFMTAMMAFFLVMWLVNAADKKTIVQVAAYFNPIRLTDRTAASDGLDNQTEGSRPGESKKGGAGKKEEHNKPEHGKKTLGSEARGEGAESSSSNAPAKPALGDDPLSAREHMILADPIPALDAIAANARQARIPIMAKPRIGAPRDPFDPSVRNAARVGPPVVTDTREKAKQQEGGKSASSGKKAEKHSAQLAHDNKTDKEDRKDTDGEAKPVGVEARAEALRHATEALGLQTPVIEVMATKEGVLVSLIDNKEEGMFEVGSSIPRPDTVIALQKIAGVVAELSGKIVLRGHTDSRVFRIRPHDNWRLSTERAQMALHMLVRGGIEDARFLAIEGRADKEPKNSVDTQAAENRRIEILIKG